MKGSGLLFLLIIISFSASAQKQKIIALSNYDYKKVHFGMSLDFGFFNLVNDYTNDFQNHPDVLSIETDGDVGLGVSFILPDLRINNRLNFRHTLSVKTVQRNIRYRINPEYDGPTEVTKNVESWFVESGLHLKYRADRITIQECISFLDPILV